MQQASDNNSVQSAATEITHNERIYLASSIAGTQLGYFIFTTGFSTFTDKAYLPRHFQDRQERLWRIECGEIQMYPAEMQLVTSKGANHYVIKPVASITPETFRRVSTLKD